jgi:hypothetical protein
MIVMYGEQVGDIKACCAGGRKPAQIVMFRDGVGEGMFEQLFRIEMGAMIRACESLEKGYRPKVIRRCSRMYERSFESRFPKAKPVALALCSSD